MTAQIPAPRIGEDVQQRIAALLAIEDPRERLRACVEELKRRADQAKQARDLRDALIYAAFDRFAQPPVGCNAHDLVTVPLSEVPNDVRLGPGLRLRDLLARYEPNQDPTPEMTDRGVRVRDDGEWLVPVWKPCDGDHKAFGMCMTHYRRYRGGASWQDLGLPGPPRGNTGWKKLAQDTSGLNNYRFSRILGRRVPAPRGRRGYWRSVNNGLATYQLPDPPVCEDPQQCWAEVGRLDKLAERLDAEAAPLRDQVRNPAMAQLYDVETVRNIAALAGLQENQVFDLRTAHRNAEAVRSARARAARQPKSA